MGEGVRKGVTVWVGDMDFAWPQATGWRAESNGNMVVYEDAAVIAQFREWTVVQWT